MSRLALLATALAAPLLLASCGGGSSDGSSGGSGGVRVVTSMYPLEYVAQRVGGDHVQVTDLTQPGKEPHDLELTVRQTAELSDADLAVYLSGFQGAVDEAVAQNGPDRVVDAADAAHLEGDDPHFWLDPVRLADVAVEVEKALADADPDHAADYAANLARLTKDLEALDQDFRQGLARCSVTTVVVSHDAFGYLGKYGLTFAPIAGLSPDTEPSPAHLAELQRLIREEGITTVFSETLASPAMSQTLARDLGLRTAVLDPVEGLSDQTAGEDYLSLMRQNLAALRTAGGCR